MLLANGSFRNILAFANIDILDVCLFTAIVQILRIQS